jgi:retron-type reverse transcriptase
MKRYGHLFETMFTTDRLHDAYMAARRGKRKRPDVQIFEANLGANIVRLHREIQEGTYRVTPYKKFIIREPKERVIYAPAFRDIVVQHDIYKEIYPIFNAGFIDQSYACRLGMGTHKAADQAWRYLKQTANSFYLKMDIKKFFYSIDRSILERQFKEKIKDSKLIQLMMAFAKFDGDGIPIGNLLSQLYALIVLNPLDHFLKRVLKCKRYVRYADDFVVFGLKDRDECHAILDIVRKYLATNLHLGLSRWTIKKAGHGINFVGYRMWPRLRLIRKYSLGKFNKALRAGHVESVVSLLGHAKQTHTLTYMLKKLRYEYAHILNQIPKQYRMLALEV